MAKTKRPYDADATRERIVDVAMDRFQLNGYHATSVADLLESAGVPGGSMYYHFPTKKSLLLAVVRERVVPAVQTTWVNAVRERRDVAAAILDVFEIVAGEIDARGRVIGCPVTNLAVELSGVDRDAQLALHEAYTLWETAVYDRLRETRTKKQARELAVLIVAAFSGAMSLAKTMNGSEPVRQCAKQISALLRA